MILSSELKIKLEDYIKKWLENFLNDTLGDLNKFDKFESRKSVFKSAFISIIREKWSNKKK